MVSYLTRMPAGIPGEVNRGWASTIEPAAITPSGTAGAPTAYGIPLVVDQTAGNVGNVRAVNSGDANTAIYGLLARPFPTQSPIWGSDPIGQATPPTQGSCDVLREGYMTVLLSGSTAAVKGNPVYIWTAAATGTHITGGFEASNPGGSGITLIGGIFMGPADASGNVEISYGVGPSGV
jgi:hypothetical protein